MFFISKKFLIILLAIVFIFLWANFQFHSNISLPTTKTFTIIKGDGLTIIADKLENEGIISSPFWFKVYAIIEGKHDNFLAGTFFLPQKINIKTLVKMLTSEKFMQLESQITLIEGWDENEIAAYLASKQLATEKDFLKFSKNNWLSADYAFLKDKPANADLEGYFYPDTYRIYQSATIEEIVRKILNNFDKKLTPALRAEIKKQNKTIFQILTLASIIEKEMNGAENRKIAAGIFWKRIKEGIPLQSDATINYFTRKGMTQPTYKDLEIENAYNTYKHYGLPPGPICNPGIDAIIAAIEPIATPYYYFLTTKTGEVIFSKTYEEHLKNKQKYLN